jgi:VWFA-related protein
VESFLAGSPPEDRAIVAVHDEGLRIVVGPTDDRPAVLEGVTEALEASSAGARAVLARRQGYREIVRALICDREPEVNCDACWQHAEAVALQQAAVVADSVERSLGALKALVDSLSGVPGRKTVLLLSDGMPQRPGLELFDYLAQVCSRYEREIARNFLAYDAMPAYLRLASKAGANRATIYALETAGLEAGGSVQDDFYSADLPTRPSGRNQQLARANRQASLHQLAEQTGGLALLDRNDLGDAMSRVEEDLAHRYVLAYRPSHPPCGREHRIQVQVAGHGDLRYREWYLHVEPEPRLAEMLQASMLYGVESDPIGVTLTAGEPAPAGGGRYVVPLRLTVPLADIVLLPEGGELVGSLRLVVTGAGSGGERLPIKEKRVPVRLSPEVVEEGEAVQHDFEIDVELAPGEWKLAVAFWDEQTGTVGVLQSGVVVGEGG